MKCSSICVVFVLFIYINGIMQLASFYFSHPFLRKICSHGSTALAHCSESCVVFLNECPLHSTLHSSSNGLEVASSCSDGHFCAHPHVTVKQFTCSMSSRVRLLGQSVLSLSRKYQTPSLITLSIYTATNSIGALIRKGPGFPHRM